MTRPRATVPRLFVDRELSARRIELDPEQAHYMSHVLRLRRGDATVVFNGRGEELLATLAQVTRRGAALEPQSRLEPLSESPLPIVLLQGLAKTDAMDLIVQKATELGVRAVLPVITRYSVVKLDAARSARRLEHWRKVSQGACEQSGRHVPLRIEAPVELQTRLAGLPGGALRLVLDPDATAPMSAAPMPRPSSVYLMSGPEGGFSDEDLRVIEAASFLRARLGPRTLRCETAALAACALAQAYWGDLR
jgi:16S rRNA (uracil1498-N3)-methyltransferase